MYPNNKSSTPISGTRTDPLRNRCYFMIIMPECFLLNENKYPNLEKQEIQCKFIKGLTLGTKPFIVLQ